MQGPEGVFLSQAVVKEGYSKNKIIVQSVVLLLSHVHLNCAASAKGFPREDKTRPFWMRSYRKDAHLPLCSGCFHCSVPVSYRSRLHEYRNQDFSPKSWEAHILSHCHFPMKPGMDCCRLGLIDKVHVRALPSGPDCEVM